MRVFTVIWQILAVIALIVVVAVVLVGGTVGWLYPTSPKPRAVQAWLLGPSLPTARGELAMAVAYGQPCAAPPCPAAERLYVMGGLSGFYRPEPSRLWVGQTPCS
jgi:hypothetical protein